MYFFLSTELGNFVENHQSSGYNVLSLQKFSKNENLVEDRRNSGKNALSLCISLKTSVLSFF